MKWLDLPAVEATAAGSLHLVYGVFVLVQTVRHREYFVPVSIASRGRTEHPEPPAKTIIVSAVFLMPCLGAVIGLAEALAPSIESAVDSLGAPKAPVGVVVAVVVVMPESLAALKAARAARLQTSLNLALGSTIWPLGSRTHCAGGK